MKPFILNALFFFLISFVSYGQTYNTLASGNWNNVTSVWSTNGVTPCGCFPGNIMNSDTIIVNHPLTLNASLNANSLSKIQVNSSGSLSNSSFDVTISNSIILANGSLSIRKLAVEAGGKFSITNSVLMVNGSIDINGEFTSILSNIYFAGGNMQVFNTGSIIIGNGTRIHFNVGNFKNGGITSICSTCCISFDQGNVTNDATGTFLGGGSVITTSGNIKNLGIWSTALSWCSSGIDIGMPTPEDCITTNNICLFAPLATELVSFDGFIEDNQAVLEWETASETNSDFYIIEYSNNGVDWEKIMEVEAQKTTNNISQYSIIDNLTNYGICYYKLRLIDINGQEKLTRQLSLINQSSADLIFYPNPANEVIFIQLNKKHLYTSLKIVDALGREIKKIEIGDIFTHEIQLPDENGIYFILAEGEELTNTFTFIKI
jgi:hypothetical protein